jgi:hypothetical protein
MSGCNLRLAVVGLCILFSSQVHALCFSVANQEMTENAIREVSPHTDLSLCRLIGGSWSVSSSDGAAISIDSATGQLELGPFDFENPSDRDSDNQYDITVQARFISVASGLLNLEIVESETFTVTVLDVDDQAPIISGDGSPHVAENQIMVGQFTANEPVIWSIASSFDGNRLELSSSGLLSFQEAPDYEQPTDSDSDNRYLVNVVATDMSGNQTMQSVVISVLDVSETVDPTDPTDSTDSADQEDAEAGELPPPEMEPIVNLQTSEMVDAVQRSIEPVQQRLIAMQENQAVCSPQVAQGFQLKVSNDHISKAKMASGLDDWLQSQGCWLFGTDVLWATGVIEVGDLRGPFDGEFDVTQLALGVERREGTHGVRGFSVGFGTTDTTIAHQSAVSQANSVAVQIYRNQSTAHFDWLRWMFGAAWLTLESERKVTDTTLVGRRDGFQFFGHLGYEKRLNTFTGTELRLVANTDGSFAALSPMRETGSEEAITVSAQTAWHVGGEVGLKIDTERRWDRWLLNPHLSTLLLIDYRHGSRYRLDEVASGNSWEATYTPNIVTGWDMQLGLHAKSGRSDWSIDLTHGLDETRRRSRMQATYRRHLLDQAGIVSWSLGQNDELSAGLSTQIGFSSPF